MTQRDRDWWYAGHRDDARRPGTPSQSSGSGHDDAKERSTGAGRLPGFGDSALPTVSLPKGGGAIRGIDEKLSVDQATGAGTLSVRVFTSPARQAFGPELTLTYHSGGGNGPFGLGWALSHASITRKTTRGLPRYDDRAESDVFILGGAEDLVPVLVDTGGGAWTRDTLPATIGADDYLVTRYRPRVEADFARIERWQHTVTGETHWRTVSATNVTHVFGLDASSRIADPADPTRIFSWLVALAYDDRGNAIAYEYKAEDRAGVVATASEERRSVGANRYLKRIRYGNGAPYRPQGPLPADWRFELVLDYGEHDAARPTPDEAVPWSCRADPFSTYRPGFELRTYRLCERLLMFHRFDELGPDPVLVRSTDLVYRSAAGGDPARPEYTLLASIAQTGWLRTAAGYDTARLPALDLGYSELAVDDTERFIDPRSAQNLVGAFVGERERWLDLDGEGLRGVLSEDEGAWYYKRNVSAWDPSGGPATARFEPVTTVLEKPATTDRRAPLSLTDLNGSGNLCAVSFSAPMPGWYERDPDGSWQPFREFATTANVDWAEHNLRFVDLDGDGLADLLLTEDDAIGWHQWVVESGFAPAQRTPRAWDEDDGPALVLAEPTGSIFLADMSGDGLSDLVRVRNGEVCYWPNLGYGRFGAKVAMDDAPVFDYPDQFDPHRIRLADVDGSGTADIAYVGPTVKLWFNRSGNAWTHTHELTQSPPTDNATQLTVFDLLGTGTACVVATSGLPADAQSPLRYVDLTGGEKPYLLTTVRNNMGAVRTLTYAPSTRFYLEDRAAGRPWITRLPFPVHVVEQVETVDEITRTRLVSGHRYHHGFYDRVEREFRGFACVETHDAESAPGPLVLPPVTTRTWFHTGAYFERDDLMDLLAREYYAGDPQAPRLARTELPLDGDAEDLREACRALRGRPLRVETYADDGSPAAVHPYSTVEHRHRVDRRQPHQGELYGAFHVWERETLECHYERVSSDPRVSHLLTLALDDYGNVTASARVGYPRRAPAFAEQGETHVRFSEADFVNVADQPDWYRLGLTVETRDYDLTQFDPDPATGLYDPDALLAGAAGAQLQLLRKHRTIYRADDLSGPLGRGTVDTLALVDRSYELHYTPAVLAPLGGKLTPAQLTAALTGGGLVDLDGDGSWWAPSARLAYSPDPLAPDAAYAQAHFFVPRCSTDPWGNVSRVTYDAHDLLVAATEDAVGNASAVENNYRTLAPWLVTDPNLNRSGIRSDALGMVIATAELGKLLQGGGDEGDHLDTSTPEAAPADDPTTHVEYDLNAYATWAADPSRDLLRPQPVYVRTRARIRHRDPATPWHESCVFTDGLGRVALTKQKAEPGPAPQRDGTGALVHAGDGSLSFAVTNDRWVGTGRVVYDNKGNAVKSYEPFFDSASGYTDESELVEWGVTAVTHYDPLGRPVRVDNPDGTFRTVEFDAWREVTSDQNDNTLASPWYAARSGGGLGADQADAASKAAAHDGTPQVADLDALGRVFRTVADNGPAGTYVTHVALDADGRPLVTTDPLGRAALSQDYDLVGGELHRSSIDAGERWLLRDANGEPLFGWDDRGHTIRQERDPLRRPTNLYVRSGGGNERIAEQIEYGETAPGAQTANLCGFPYLHRDTAGVATTTQRDFKGNVAASTRRILSDYRDDVDWGLPQALEPDVFATSATFDALNRPLTTTAPDGSLTTTTFNERSLLASVTARGTPVVAAVTYDAKGQRERIDYANGSATDYTYDPLTFRLTRLHTTRGADTLQDLSYAYDPVGNVTRLSDAAQQTIFFNGQVVSASADYTYDPLYRLTIATGREHVGQQTSWDESARIAVPLPGDAQAMRAYSETYAYDPAGNIASLAHTAAGGNWTRTYAYDEPNAPPQTNRLTSATVGAATEHYAYDAHGNATTMPHLSLVAWDWRDQLAASASQLVLAGVPETTYYRYDNSGQRITKTTDRQGGTLAARRVYLGGYELYREYDNAGSVTLERTTLQVADGAKVVCILETTTLDSSHGAPPTPWTLTRFQLANHLGSAQLELDGTAAVITYEEFFPFGATSFQSGRSAAEVSLKRYRYAGKERDRETGLDHVGVRYYCPWLGRFTTAEPLLAGAPQSPYAYAANNPVKLADPNGRDPEPSFWQVQAQYWSGVGDGAVELGRGLGQMARHPINTVVAVGDHVSEVYHRDGLLSAVNELNPAYHAMVAGYEYYQAAERGDAREAGHQAFRCVTNIVATVGVAAGGAGLAAPVAEGAGITATLGGTAEVVTTTGLRVAVQVPARTVTIVSAQTVAAVQTAALPVAGAMMMQASGPPGPTSTAQPQAPARQPASSGGGRGGPQRRPAQPSRGQQGGGQRGGGRGGGSRGGGGRQRTSLQPRFMEAMRRQIAANANHPLRFLLDANGRWLSRTHLSELPTVQAGHLVSFHSGAPEALALEDSFFNQLTNWTGERYGAIFEKAAVEIEGIPVELRTAEAWEAAGELPQGTVARAMAHAGWTGP